MAGYVRQDSTNNIADGNVINASDLDNEYDALEAAFHASTGHSHDGTSAEGAPITKVGPAQDVVVGISSITPKTDNTLDLGSSIREFKDLWIDGVANIDSLVADTADINAGTIDGVTIGGASAGAGTFTTLAATTGNITSVTSTTVESANVEVTFIKAVDGTSSATIANSTGVMTIASSVLTTADINGGTMDNVTIGASTAAVGTFTTMNAGQAQVDNLNLNNNTLSSTNTNGSILLVPNGTGRTTVTNLSATSPRFTTGINDSNGNELFLLTATASAVNEITVANATTGNAPTLTSSGGDTNIDLVFAAKGTGQVKETWSSSNWSLASQYDIGTNSNQIPLNQYLGSMAYQDAAYVSVIEIDAGTVNATTIFEQGKPVVTSADVGTLPNQIPLNQYLGAMAYQDSVSSGLEPGGGITLGTGTICQGTFSNMDGVKRATIVLDLTGLSDGGAAGDIIGSTSTSIDSTKQPAYIAQLPVAFTVLGGRMTCLETPAGGDTDIDLYSATEGTGVQDSAVSALTETQIVNGGAQTAGTVVYFSADPAASSYLYMVSQGTGAAAYTAGRFLIEIFGV